MSNVITPIYLKESDDGPWPEDGIFYLLASNGLFLCRHHETFRSCAPVQSWPSELAAQQSFLEPAYPVVPRALMEQLVGFFSEMATRHGCEAGAYLVYDTTSKTTGSKAATGKAATGKAAGKQFTVQVPPQVSTVREGFGDALYAIGLDYDHPEPLPAHQLILGTVHSHVYGAAYASGIDVHDEVGKPGVHIVVGRLDREPPDLHVEAVVDGNRFRLEPEAVIEDYQERRDDFPTEWISKVRVEIKPRWQERVYLPPEPSYPLPSSSSSRTSSSS